MCIRDSYWVDADSCRDLIPDEEVGAVLFHLYEGKQNGIILIALKQDFFENILDVTALDQDCLLYTSCSADRISWATTIMQMM